jgi:hypothetical protein
MRPSPIVFALLVSAAAVIACSEKGGASKFSEPSAPAKPAPTTSAPDTQSSTVPPVSPSTGNTSNTGQTARDSSAGNPSGNLEKSAESSAMPQAGHGNNHSSPSMESGKASDDAGKK